MGITYTPSGSAAFTESFTLDLYAGTLETDTAWLDGGAAAGSYPGSISGFQAKNTNTTNATAGAKLVCGQFTTKLVNDETITLSGDATKILAVIVGDNSTASAAVTLKNITAGVAQFTVTGTSDALVTCWMIVA
jgi:hypothetical protein